MNIVLTDKIIKDIYKAKSLHILKWASNDHYILVTWDNLTMRLCNYDNKLYYILSSVAQPIEFKVLFDLYMSMYSHIVATFDSFEDFHLINPVKKIYAVEGPGPDKKFYFVSGRLIPGPLRKSRYFYHVWDDGRRHNGIYIMEGDIDHEDSLPVMLVMGCLDK